MKDGAIPTLKSVRQQLQSLADPSRAQGALRFFKTGPGEYGEGDLFLGITVPQLRQTAKQFSALEIEDLITLLRSRWHEERLLALLLLVRRFERSRPPHPERKSYLDLYLAHTEFINNWDLVDASAPYLLGQWLVDKPDERVRLDKLARSKSLWEQRIAMVATLALIRAGQYEDTVRLAQQFLSHRHDLMHKACGWMLREAGKRHPKTLQTFLDQHASAMPRTMLRYAIERLPERERKAYLAGRSQRTPGS